MNVGKNVFTQIVQFLPRRYFERLVIKHKDRTAEMAQSYWSHLLVIMYSQLIGCQSLRELTFLPQCVCLIFVSFFDTKVHSEVCPEFF